MRAWMHLRWHVRRHARRTHVRRWIHHFRLHAHGWMRRRRMSVGMWAGVGISHNCRTAGRAAHARRHHSGMRMMRRLTHRMRHRRRRHSRRSSCRYGHRWWRSSTDAAAHGEVGHWIRWMRMGSARRRTHWIRRRRDDARGGIRRRRRLLGIIISRWSGFRFRRRGGRIFDEVLRR